MPRLRQSLLETAACAGEDAQDPGGVRLSGSRTLPQRARARPSQPRSSKATAGCRGSGAVQRSCSAWPSSRQPGRPRC